MSGSRLDVFTLERFPKTDWSGEDKPVAIVDGQVIPVSRDVGPLRGSVAWVVGVDDRTFPALCARLQAASLAFYEMRVSDLGPLAGLDGIRELGITWNTKVVDLEPLRSLRDLELLVLQDIPKVRSIDAIGELEHLVALDFSGGIWNRNRAQSLEPIGRLGSLQELVLTNLAVASDGLRPLARCRSLRRLSLSNQFATEDYAYLAARLPQVECEMFAPFVPLGQAIGGNDVMVVGKRKPFLNASKDADRLARYVRDFERLQSGFAEQPRGTRS
jgi:hypothetical protein